MGRFTTITDPNLQIVVSICMLLLFVSNCFGSRRNSKIYLANATRMVSLVNACSEILENPYMFTKKHINYGCFVNSCKGRQSLHSWKESRRQRVSVRSSPVASKVLVYY